MTTNKPGRRPKISTPALEASSPEVPEASEPEKDPAVEKWEREVRGEFDANDLEGIEFADVESQVAQQHQSSSMDNLARAEADQRAAMAAIARQKTAARTTGRPYIPETLGQRPRPPTKAELKEILARKKFYLVLQDKRIRRGAADYILTAGKIFDNNQYDIESLLRQGVQLKEVDPKDIHYRPAM